MIKPVHVVTDDECIIEMKSLIMNCKLCGCEECRRRKNRYRYIIDVLSDHAKNMKACEYDDKK